ncbi:hypothetical protein WA026_015677 [Henosepilachna vigintioctopunctata]|uniref:Uncharacterized protein n=1 Tax=Henosepilachna vigintioctopunctata TaxID=420089 RepID=A0AAW1URK3_9CUCU
MIQLEIPEAVGAEVDEDFPAEKHLVDDACNDVLQPVIPRKSLRTPKPKQFEDYITYACVNDTVPGAQPVTVEEALSCSNADKWKQAMLEEL